MTQPLGGDIVHYVFWDKNSHLFAMPLNLFRCNNRSLKVTVCYCAIIRIWGQYYFYC